MSFCEPETLNASIGKGEDNISWRNFSYSFIEVILLPVAIFLWTPDVSSDKFLLESLIVINPPVSHSVVAPHRSLPDEHSRELSKYQNKVHEVF